MTSDGESDELEFVPQNLDEALLIAVKADDIEKVKSLLAQGASPDARNSPTKKNALMSAASRGYSEIIKILLGAGASTKEVEILRNTALHFACVSGVVKSVELLLEAGSPLNLPNSFNKTPFMCAIMHNRVEVVRYLVKRYPQIRVGFVRNDDSELTLACSLPDLKLAHCLLGKFYPLNAVHNEIQFSFIRAIVHRRLDVLHLLVDYGADVNYTDMFLDPPIFTAIRVKDPLILQYILGLGADINKKCFGGDTPLLFAISHFNDFAVKLLLKKGAKVNATAARARLKILKYEIERRLTSMEAVIEEAIGKAEEKKQEDVERANKKQSVQLEFEKANSKASEKAKFEPLEMKSGGSINDSVGISVEAVDGNEVNIEDGEPDKTR